MPAKRCPMCHRASERTAGRCSCGYAFGQNVEKVRDMLRAQLRTSWLAFGALLVADVALVALAAVALAMTPVLVLAALVGATGRQARKILVSRESLRQLAPAELPTARLLT